MAVARHEINRIVAVIADRAPSIAECRSVREFVGEPRG
jgi:hypothetical protein